MRKIKNLVFILIIIINLDIIVAAPSLTLTPDIDTKVNLGDKLTISCSASDNIKIKNVLINVDGDIFCSGKNFCSINYVASNSKDKIITCISENELGASDLKSIKLMTNNAVLETNSTNEPIKQINPSSVELSSEEKNTETNSGIISFILNWIKGWFL